MFNFNLQQHPIAVTLACPVCQRQQVEHSGQSIVAQKLALCGPHRAHFEKLLRDYTVPRQAITVWLAIWRKTRIPV